MIRTLICISLLAGFAFGQQTPETNLVHAGTETQSPLFPGGEWQHVNGTSIKTLSRQSDGSFWRWSPNATHHQAAVRIQAGNAGGSGVCVATKERTCFVLTNHHVIEGHQIVSVRWQSGQQCRGEVVAYRHSTQEDVALVRVSNPPANWIGLPIATREPPAGTDLEMVGFGGPEFGRKRSFFGKTIRTNESHAAFRIDAATISGDSGSGILWNKCIVGVNYGGPGIVTRMRGVGLVYPATSGVGPTFLVRWLSQCCPPYGGSPQYSDPYSESGDGGGFYNPPSPVGPSPSPIIPQIPMDPVTPQPQPQPQSPSEKIVIVQPVDIDKIKKEIADGIVGKQGAAGAPGPAGPAGPPGPMGPAGSAATVTQEHLQQIVSMVLSQLPEQKPIYMRQVDGRSGKVLKVDEIFPGEGFTFKVYPGVVNDAN